MASLRYPGVTEGAAQGIPGKFQIEELAACPPGSLGGALHRLVVEEGFDLEVLDRDALGLATLVEPLDSLNIRILQCHDVWHEVAGYETTGLHEIAISGFQMGQFGHHYSSTFLAMVFTKAAWTQPIEGTHLLMDTVLAAWVHGRETPPLLGVEWEEIWAEPMEDIRSQLGIVPYDSPYPAGILELIRNA
jgi:ubiquinone biosynthesis protein Coq4